MPWNFERIREACKEKNLAYPEIYIRSLSWQQWKAEYHAQRAEEIWIEFKSAHTGGYAIAGSNRQWWKAYYTSAAETEATVHAINAEADIIAQVINKVMLRNPVPETNVAYSDILRRLRNQSPTCSVATAMEEFIDSDEFKYIRAFCNTSKHRNLVEKEYRFEGGVATAYTEGMRFKAFRYRNDSFQITWASSINGPYRETLEEFVQKIGDAIIDYLT